MSAIILSSAPGVGVTNLPQEPLPEFDLSFVRDRVAREHPNWSQDRLANAELDYRFYLARCKTPHQASLSPSSDADEFWHAHILYTREYARDCQNYFGHFLHHVPLAEGDCGEDGECKTQCYVRPGKCGDELTTWSGH